MTLENVLTKMHKKLANDEIGLAIQKCDSEMGELALTCLRKKRANQSSGNATGESKLDSIKNILLSGLSSAKHKIQNTPGGANIASGLGGAALGSLFGNISSSKGEFETDEDFKRRKRNSTLSGLVAGGAIGASVPSILNSLGGISKSITSGQGEQKETLKNNIKNIVNPTTILGTTGLAGGGFLNNYLTKNNLAILTDKAREEGGEAFQKAIGDSPLLKLPSKESVKPLLKNFIKVLGKNKKTKFLAPVAKTLIRGGTPVVSRSANLLESLSKRKFLLPTAGAAAVPALNELYLGDEFFDQPVFNK